MNFNALRAILARKSEFWRTTNNDPHGIATAVYVALKEAAEATTEAEASLSPELIHVAITRQEFRSLPIEAQRRILEQQADKLVMTRDEVEG